MTEDEFYEDMKEEEKLVREFLKLLNKTKREFWKIWDKFGYDAAFFDWEIDLMIRLGNQEVRIKEKGEPISLEG